MGGWGETAGTAQVKFEPSGGRSIGYEFEANWPADAMYRWYDHDVIVKNDGSLRGYSAAEVITPTPTMLDQFNYEEWLRQTPLDQGIGCNRNGTHVWFGTPDITWFGMNKILFYCATHQSQFKKAVCAQRTLTMEPTQAGTPVALNAWTPALYDSKAAFIRSLYGKGDEFAVETPDGWVNRLKDRRPNNHGETFAGPIHRCWWFNVAAYFHSRCVEVRLLHFTPVVDVMVAWTELWLRVLDKVPLMSTKELLETKVKDLCPPTARIILFDNRVNDREVAHGMTTLDMDYHSTQQTVLKEVGKLCVEKGWVA